MVRDQVTGWAPIQRISVLTARARRMGSLCATRWVAPTGVDATILTQRILGSTEVDGPVVASAAAAARDAGLESGLYVVDPQLCWHEIDGRVFLVSPLLGFRLSVRAAHSKGSGVGLGGGVLGRLPSRPCRVLIEALPSASDIDSPVRCASIADLAPGVHLGMVTKWPLPTDRGSEVATIGMARPSRLAPPPAALPRDVVRNAQGHSVATLEPSNRSAGHFSSVVAPPEVSVSTGVR